MNFQKVLSSNDFSLKANERSEEIEAISNLLSESKIEDPIERSVGALLAFYKRNQPEEVEELLQETIPGTITIFSDLVYPSELPAIKVSDVARFSKPLLPINETRNDIMVIEQYSGEREKLAGTIANEIIKDLQASTSYPPEPKRLLDTEVIVNAVNTISTRIHREREDAKQKAIE